MDKYYNKILEILEMNSEEFEILEDSGVEGESSRIATVNKIGCTELPQIFKDLSLVANFVMCSKE